MYMTDWIIATSMVNLKSSVRSYLLELHGGLKLCIIKSSVCIEWRVCTCTCTCCLPICMYSVIGRYVTEVTLKTLNMRPVYHWYFLKTRWLGETGQTPQHCCVLCLISESCFSNLLPALTQLWCLIYDVIPFGRNILFSEMKCNICCCLISLCYWTGNVI